MTDAGASFDALSAAGPDQVRGAAITRGSVARVLDARGISLPADARRI